MSRDRHITRDRHVAGQPPGWSKKANELRPLTESEKKAADEEAAYMRQREREDRKAGWVLLGMAWGVGLLVAGYFAALALGANLP